MTKLRLLDMYCGAGGAGMGYSLAGFEVVGVDILPQKRYPFEFHQGDAIEYLLAHHEEFDAFSASPPCQLYSTMRKGLWKDRVHSDLIAPTRVALKKTLKPYVIENVENARKFLVNPIKLCGSMFGLQTPQGNSLRRHRYFECSLDIEWLLSCQHNGLQSVGVYGNAGGSSKRDGKTMFGVSTWKQVMGIDWMTGKELAQAIPPKYTEYIGSKLKTLMASRTY